MHIYTSVHRQNHDGLIGLPAVGNVQDITALLPTIDVRADSNALKLLDHLLHCSL